ncbi:MAG: GDYXXLXY domain-containing protein [Tenacibaculum sp.]|nr:GDYXXLXY domain-containing protein [Tenacibaculum sp.]
MKKYKWPIVFGNLILLLVYFNYSIFKKETLLKEGQLVLLELAPVDPRSLMQGDYMRLRYNLSRNNDADIPKRGFCIVQLDSNNVASKVRFQKDPSSLNEGELPIEYTSPNNWNINIGAESFFFQEGDAEKYEKAKYGGLKIDAKGNSLLIGLYDEHRAKIE